MTRDHYLALADGALNRAERLADNAENLAHSSTQQGEGAALAAVGALWSDIARSYVAVAATMPTTEAQG